MDTDKIYAEAIANEYAVRDESKVIALKSSTQERNARQRFLSTR